MNGQTLSWWDPDSILRDGDPGAGVKPYQFDDLLIRTACDSSQVKWSLDQPSKTMVVMGRSCIPGVEIDLARCADLEIPVFRRYGGGCSVVLDPGNLVVSIVFPTAKINSPKMYFEKATDWVIDAIQKFGVANVGRASISDLVVGNRKIGGSCIYQTKWFAYFSATILVDPDLATIVKCLKHPPREPEYRNGRRHDSFLMGIGHLVSPQKPWKAAAVAPILRQIMAQSPL